MIKNTFSNPFPGLRPFQKNESVLFFGRENHVNEIIRKLNLYRFVSIVGNSGSGKSSLVRAGILPKIEESKEEEWIVATMRPGNYPIEQLTDVLFSESIFGSINQEERMNQIRVHDEILNKNRLGLVQTVRSHLPEGKKLLILVDQFEEIFRFSKNFSEDLQKTSDQHFIELLLDAVSQKEVPIYVIMTIRSDFLGDCEQFTGLPEAINDGQFLIPRMNKEELQKSITQPIDLVHGKISPQLVYRLLNELGNSPDQLPLLQHVLMRTWEVWQTENNPKKPIDDQTYEKTGGLTKALSNHAEEAFGDLKSLKNKEIAEALFKTITLKGKDNRGIRRPTELQQIVEITGSKMEDLIDVIEIFRRPDRGFLMPPSGTTLHAKSVIDISHESLMRIWERLEKWVNEEAESAEIYIRICESALLYDKNMAGLSRDPALQIAIDWREKNKPNRQWALQYNEHFDLAMRFIEASIQQKKYVLAEKRRRKMLTRMVITFFLITVSALAIWAYVERYNSVLSEKSAQKEKQKALTQEAIAREQKQVAEVNAQKAELAQAKAEEQRQIAFKNAMEAEIQKMKAEKASLNANEARKAAELDKKIAQKQKELSDSLRNIADRSSENAYRLRILTIAQTLAVKSSQAKKGSYKDGVKHLLALQANKFNNEYKGNSAEPEIYKALFSSYEFLYDKSDYLNNKHKDEVNSVCFSPDGKQIASLGNDGILMIHKSDAINTPLYTFKQQNLLLENLCYHQSGKKLSASGDNKKISIFNTGQADKNPKQLDITHDDKISALLWYKDLLISASFDKKIRIIDEAKSQVINSIILDSKPFSMAINPKNNTLIIGCEDGNLYSLDLINYGSVKLYKKLNHGRINTIDVSINGDKILCGTSEGRIVYIPTDSSSDLTVIIAHSSGITSIKLAPNSNRFASASLDNKIKLWSSENDDQPIVYEEHESFVWTIAFNKEGNKLISGAKDKTMRLYYINKQDLVEKIEAKVSKDFTQAEWNKYVGADIPYEKTISKK